MNRESKDAILCESAYGLNDSESALKMAVFSCGTPDSAASFIRLASPIRHLERQNRLQLQWCVADNSKICVEKLLDSDLFILQREFCDRRISFPVIAAARELRKPIVFELDDLLLHPPQRHPEYKRYAEMTPDILAMLRNADFVTVTTEPLRRGLEEAESQAKGKIHVWPNFINLDIWDGAAPPPETPQAPFVIGWSGTSTHDEDLAIIKPAIVRIARKYAGKVVFKFWGYLPNDLKDIPGVQLVRGQIGNVTVHARDILNNRIDLALAPLLDHPFNHAKSDLKWLEYSIGYTPAVFSTISPYTASVEHGRTGWLVDNQPELWVEAIERLMRDHELRRSIAVQAHDEVLRNRTVGTGAEQWDALYRSFHTSSSSLRLGEAVAGPEARDRAAAYLKQFAADAARRRGSWVTRKFRKIKRWTRKVRNRIRGPAELDR